MTGPCGLPGCPVPSTPFPTGLRTVVWPAGTVVRRGYRTIHSDPTELVPGVGDTRFAPLDGIEHAYVASTTFAALLESAFHDAAPPAPHVPPALLARWAEAQMTLTRDVRLIDLRDDHLERLGLARSALVATPAAHYPCTRRWAGTLHGRRIGGQPTHGLVWHSRQAELHTAAMTHRPAVTDLLDYHPAEVAVLWSPPAPRSVLTHRGSGLGPLDGATGFDYVADLADLLEITLL